MVFPEKENHYHAMIGAQAMRMLDVSAFVAASRVARLPLVTARIEDFRFLAPLLSGRLAESVSQVCEVKEKEIAVEAKLFSEDLLSGARELCVRGRFYFRLAKTAQISPP